MTALRFSFSSFCTILFLFPLVGFAQQNNPNPGYFKGLIEAFAAFIDLLIPFIFALAFLVFLWGIFTYFILGGADESKRESGKQLMLYGIIGFVVMVAIWGIVNVFLGLFGFTGGDTITTPDRPQPRQ